MTSKCAGIAVWGLWSTLTFAIIHCLLQSFSRTKKEFRTGCHVSKWSKLLSTLISRCFVSHSAMFRDVSVVVTQFLRELFFALILSLLLRPLCFPSQHHFGTPRCVVLGLHLLCPSVFQPIECFFYEGPLSVFDIIYTSCNDHDTSCAVTKLNN